MLSDFNRKGKVKCRTDQRHRAITLAARSWWKPAGSTVRSTCLSIQKPPGQQQSVDTTDVGRKPGSRILKHIRSVCSVPSRASTSGQRWWTTSFRTVVTRNFSGTRSIIHSCLCNSHRLHLHECLETRQLLFQHRIDLFL